MHDKQKYQRNAPKKKKSPVKTQTRGTFTVDDVDTDELARFISKCHAHGAAVMFTQNRDRNVFGVRLYHDDCDNQTVWVNAIDDLRNLELFLDELTDDTSG